MQFRTISSRVAFWGFVIAAAATYAGPPAASPVTYQGQLRRDGAPANGVFDFQFTLRQADGVTFVDRTCAFDLLVINGLFQAELEFAASSFDGSPRMLQLGVRNAVGGIHDCTSNTIGSLFELLTPLQPIHAAPYALRAFSAPTGSSLNAADGSPVNALVVDNAGRVGIGTATPAEELTIAGDALLSTSGQYKGISGALGFLSNLGNGPPGVRLESTTDIDINLDTDNNSPTSQPNTLRIYGNGTSRATVSPILLVTDEGKVNIGGTNFSPDRRLEVGGVSHPIFDPGDPITEIEVFQYLQDDVAPPGFHGATAGIFLNSLIDFPDVLNRKRTEALFRAEANVDGTQLLRIVADSADTDIVLETDAGEAMRIDSGLNIGVGTATPARRLHVSNGPSGGVSQTAADLLVEDNASCYINVLAPDASERGVSFGSPADAVHGGVYYTNASGMTLRTDGNSTRMVIEPGGNLGIGTVGRSVDGRLHVQSDNARVAKFDRFSSDGELVAFARDDGAVGTITVSSGIVSYNAFTGSHYAWTDREILLGALVSLNGTNKRLGDRVNSEVVYGIDITTRANDSACLGIFSGSEEPTRAAGSDNPHLVAAVGNGELCVVDRGGGDIEPGDYLISSDVAGCAMKDDPARFAVGHVIAKAADRIRWAEVVADERGLKRAKSSVLFGAFVRAEDTTELRNRVERLEAALLKVEEAK